MQNGFMSKSIGSYNAGKSSEAECSVSTGPCASGRFGLNGWLREALGLKLVGISLATVFSAGCFSSSRGQLLEERVDRLEFEKKDLEQALKRQKIKLDEQMADAQKAMDKLEKTAHRTGADIAVQVEQLQTDLSATRGQVEQYQHKIAELEAAIQKIGSSETADSGKKSDGGVSRREPIEKPTDKKAFAELVEKKLEDEPRMGRELAEEWLKKWPKDSLRPRIHFALGSSYFKQSEWSAALSEFGEISTNYTKSDYVPEALLKSSDCFLALKMPDRAKLVLEEILRSHPKSDAAAKAKGKLAKIKTGKK